MSRRFPLFWLSLFRRRRLLIALALGLAAFESLIVLITATIPTDQLFSSKPLPDSYDSFSGSSGAVGLGSVAGLLGAGLLHPFWIALQLSAVGSLTAAIAAADVEEGTIELVAVRPIRRGRILFERLAACIIASTALTVIGIAPIAISSTFSQTISRVTSPSGLFFATFAGFCVTLAFIGVGVAASCRGRHRSSVIAAVGGSAAATYALNFLGSMWRDAEWIKYASPFHYYRPADALVMSTVSATDVLVLLVIFVVGTLAGWVRFRRRDLTR